MHFRPIILNNKGVTNRENHKRKQTVVTQTGYSVGQYKTGIYDAWLISSVLQVNDSLYDFFKSPGYSCFYVKSLSMMKISRIRIN